MPHSKVHVPQAPESPWLRLNVRFADGRLGSMSIWSSCRPEIGDDPTTYKRELQAGVENLLHSRGIELLRIEHVNTYTLEIGEHDQHH